MSPAQQRALTNLLPRFGLPFAQTPLDFTRVFGRAAPVILEIGFGMGETTAAMAAACPAHDFLGLEVHGPGVGALLNRVEAAQLSNVRVIQHDAVEVLQQMIPWPGSTCIFQIPGPRNAITSGVCCSPRSYTQSHCGSPPAATCTRRPTGPNTPM